MRRNTVIAVLPVIVAMLVTACGSSSTSGSKAPASAGSSAPTANGSPASSSAPTALITTKRDKLGTILAYGPKRLTVYLFEADKGASSSCSGACAAAWPPVIGKPQAQGEAVASDLGTIKRPDGSTQVTYKGHPLYLFIKDKDDGDAYGEGNKGFGADWYALAPSGNKVDQS